MSSDAQKGRVVPPAVPLVGADERVTIGLRVQDRYRIVSELGSGAFGTVCLAEDGVTAQRVAIRFLPRGLAAIPGVARAVQSRARSLIGGTDGKIPANRSGCASAILTVPSPPMDVPPRYTWLRSML